MEYSVGDLVRCMWGSKPVEYEAKIIHANSATKEYFVHYQGWNKRYDEWISEKSILGSARKQQTTSPHHDTPKVRHSRREKKVKKPIDWSPTSSATTHAAEKPVVEKVSNKHHVPISSKRKHSPVAKVAKSRPISPPQTTMDDVTEESATSDEEEGADALPRSYIDVLAKAKKRAERKSQQRTSPKTAKHRSPKISSKSTDHGEADHGDLHGAQPSAECEKSSTTASSADVTSTSVECHGFSSIGGDHNYSSLRFHYNETPPPSAAEKDPGNGHVTSSTRRVHILPVRKPLDIEYTLPYSPSMFKFVKPSPMNLTRRQRVDVPPNLGSPFAYCDEYHSSMPVPMEFGTKGSCGEEAVAVSNFVNADISDSVTTSSSYSESEGSLSDQPQIMIQEPRSPFTVST